jgi:hypothetical protein
VRVIFLPRKPTACDNPGDKQNDQNNFPFHKISRVQFQTIKETDSIEQTRERSASAQDTLRAWKKTNQRRRAPFREKSEASVAIREDANKENFWFTKQSCNFQRTTEKPRNGIWFCCAPCAGTAGICSAAEFFAAQQAILQHVLAPHFIADFAQGDAACAGANGISTSEKLKKMANRFFTECSF